MKKWDIFGFKWKQTANPYCRSPIYSSTKVKLRSTNQTVSFIIIKKPEVMPVTSNKSLLLGAGNEKIFLPNCYLHFKSNLVTGNYHNVMNFANYTKRIDEKLIPSLKSRCVLVIDNTPYYNFQKDKCPNMMQCNNGWLSIMGHLQIICWKQIYPRFKS